METLELYLRSYADTEVRLRVYATDKPQNYRPVAKVADLTVPVSGDEWVAFPVDAAADSGQKLMAVLDPNPQVLVRYATTAMTGVLGLNFKPDDPPTWMTVLPYVPCFRMTPKQRPYRPENVINGHIRPYGLPHLWASEALDPAEPAWLELELARPCEVHSVELVFNSALNRGRHAITGMHPELVKDYDVLAEVDGRTVCLVRERGNFLRFRRHTFDTVKAKRLRLVVHATWGSRHAEVFDFRVYATARVAS